jgi:hypothetical protein
MKWQEEEGDSAVARSVASGTDESEMEGVSGVARPVQTWIFRSVGNAAEPAFVRDAGEQARLRRQKLPEWAFVLVVAISLLILLARAANAVVETWRKSSVAH